jgi:hypothetical protein
LAGQSFEETPAVIGFYGETIEFAIQLGSGISPR